MRRSLALGFLLLSGPLAAEEPRSDAPLDGSHFFIGPSLQAVQSFGGTGSSYGGPASAFGLQMLVDSGNWMFGGELRVGVVRSPSLFISSWGRIDRYLQPGTSALYAGGSFGFLDEFDGEYYGGEGASAGAQVGYLWGRARRWGRIALELQLTVPLFGERANKPGNYVYPFVSLGVRFFL